MKLLSPATAALLAAADQAARFPIRLPYVLEALEARRHLTVVPADLTAGVPYQGLIATDLVLPKYATGPELVNVMINGQWDYQPKAVLQSDGTYDLYTDFVPQQSGTGEVSVWFRNDRTGGWDILEIGQAAVKQNHFNAPWADENRYNLISGTQYRDAVTTLKTSPLTRSLDQYAVEVSWFGEIKPGRLVAKGDGTVDVFVDDGYLPTRDGDPTIEVKIREIGAPADAPLVGYARLYLSARPSIGFGTFRGVMVNDTDLKVILPKEPLGDGAWGKFTPAEQVEGWHSDFTVNFEWQYRDDNLSHTTGQIVREADGSYSAVVKWPTNFRTDGGMIRIKETVHRPAIGDRPAETYRIEYVGSFGGPGSLIPGTPSPSIPESPPTPPVSEPEQPTETGGGVVMPVEPQSPPVDVPASPEASLPGGAGDDPTSTDDDAEAVPSPLGGGGIATETDAGLDDERVSTGVLAIGDDDTLFGETANDRLVRVVG